MVSMRIRWIAIPLVILVVVVLALPAIGYMSIPKPEPALDATVTVTFKAYRASATDYSKTGFSIDWAVAPNASKVSYFSYIGQYWGDIISPAQTSVPGSFPFVATTVVTGGSIRIVPDDYTLYTYGDYFEKSFTFNVLHGTVIMGQVQIYHAQSASIYISEYFTVP